MKRLALVLLLLTALSFVLTAQTPAVIETSLLTRLSSIEKWSNYGTNPDDAKLERANDLFKADLLRYGRLSSTLTYDFPRLKKGMEIETSKDGRLRIYSWDRGSGGTMHDFDRVYQYRGASGKVYSWSPTGTSESVSGGFCHEIFQLDTPPGPIYLEVSTFIASGSLREESIAVVRINGEKITLGSKLIRTSKGLENSINFSYDISSVDAGDEGKLFKFDAAKRSFSFPVVIEDEETPQGRVTDKRITYRFDGQYFEQVR